MKTSPQEDCSKKTIRNHGEATVYLINGKKKTIKKVIRLDRNKICHELVMNSILKCLKNCLTYYKFRKQDETNETIYTLHFNYGGETLEDYIKNNTLSKIEKKNIMLQILDGIDGIHERGVIHMDLKTENILVKNGNINIIDFGNSVRTVLYEKMNRFGNMCTIYFTSPEAILDLRVTYKHDIFSTAMVFYYIWYGNDYYKVYSKTEVVEHMFKDRNGLHLMDKYEYLEEYISSCNKHYKSPREEKGFDGLFYSMSHLHPEKRPTLEEIRKIVRDL